MVEYIVAIDVARVRFPADAIYCNPTYFVGVACVKSCPIAVPKSNLRGALHAAESDSCGVRTRALADWRLKPAP